MMMVKGVHLGESTGVGAVMEEVHNFTFRSIHIIMLWSFGSCNISKREKDKSRSKLFPLIFVPPPYIGRLQQDASILYIQQKRMRVAGRWGRGDGSFAKHNLSFYSCEFNFGFSTASRTQRQNASKNEKRTMMMMVMLWWCHNGKNACVYTYIYILKWFSVPKIFKCFLGMAVGGEWSARKTENVSQGNENHCRFIWLLAGLNNITEGIVDF